MHLARFLILAISVIHLFITVETSKRINGDKCTDMCQCKRVENSSKVQVATCTVTSQDTLLQCSVEWPVLYLTLEVYQVDSTLLLRCQRIKRLKIRSNSLLTVLRSDMFQYGKHLENLVVKAPIQILDSVLLRHLTSLQKLDISETKIDIISRAIFEECPISDSLRLASNKILSIEDGSFKTCVYLLTLDLSGNLLSKINYSTFEGAFNLKELDLSKNKIETIDDMSFKHLKKLKNLSLKENMLQSVKQDTFRGLESLIHLRLQSNKLVYIAVEAFKDLQAIRVINLKDNRISRLDLILFLHLQQLNIIFPDVNCVQSRDEDTRFVSANVLAEFGKYPLCDGLKRMNTGHGSVQERQQLVQPTTEKTKVKSPGADPILDNIWKHPYLISMIFGGLTVTLVSIIIISVVCHVKNKKIHELQLQEVQLPMMQSTL